MSKMNRKSRTIFEAEGKIPTSKPKKYSTIEPQFNQNIIFPKNDVDEETEGSRAKLKNEEIASENAIYVSQLQELARHFSSIVNSIIRQYGINLMRELAKCENEEKAKKYADEMMG